MRRLLASTCLALLSGALLTRAEARTIEIKAADRLELRKIDSQELVVISGAVELNVDQDVIRADRVEYNKTRRTLTLVGHGYYKSSVKNGAGADTEQVLTGDSLVVNLGSENLAGEDVVITTQDLQIRGEQVERVPGQLQAQGSYFTPCARCGRTPNDYAFRAKRVLLFPGDRLVAYDATLLLADAPVAYFPIVVLFLNDPDRQPKFEVGQNEQDGFYARIGLPFVIGSSAQGFNTLRYYQNRTPQVGFGVDMSAYDLGLGVQRLDLQALAEPRRLDDPAGGAGYDLDFSVKATGQIDWLGTKSGVSYTLSATRSDTTATPERKGVGDVDFSAKVGWDAVDATLTYAGRFGPSVLGPLPRVLRHPELDLDFQPLRSGDLSADFRVTLGSYTAASNKGLRSVQGFDNVGAERLLEQHTITYETKPWSGATFGVTNTFTGQYYSTGARVVNLSVAPSLRQDIGRDTSFALRYNYQRLEGVSPFAFDPSYPTRTIAATLSGEFRSQPFPWLQLSAAQAYDFIKPADQQGDQGVAKFGVTVNPSPINLQLGLGYNFFLGRLENWQASFGVGGGVGLAFNTATSFTRTVGYSLLVNSLAYTDPDRSGNAKLTVNYNLQKGYLDSVQGDLAGTATRDAILNPVTVNATENFSVQNPRITGSESLTWRGLTFGSSHNFLLPDAAVEAEDPSEGQGTLKFGVSSPSGGATSWKVEYGDAYDLRRSGWTAPTLSGSFTSTRANQTIQLNTTVSMPGIDRPYLYVSSASVLGQWDLTPRIGLAGEVAFQRTRSGPVGENISDTLAFRNFGLTFALGSGERPGAYFTAALNQTFVFGPGAITPQPIEPIFRLNVDRCCWALGVELNAREKRVRVGLTLPAGGQSLEVTRDQGVQFPGLNTQATGGRP